SPKLRTLRYLHIRWDSYPAGTTFAGTGLSPAGTTNLSRRTWTRTTATLTVRAASVNLTYVHPNFQRTN
ncbi:MAG: hypothetical protein K8R46_05295, partial [Pirellulales bacterium]|nr:hypothetical protein [Pirellulales bacterium]